MKSSLSVLKSVEVTKNAQVIEDYERALLLNIVIHFLQMNFL